ncbi:MAG: hypothetical protein KGJ49_05820 [Alphaproteobacteria bacterium]|nr:hypothetical protein [Alphaproteobacteria bacterium]
MKTHKKIAFAASALVLSVAVASAQGVTGAPSPNNPLVPTGTTVPIVPAGTVPTNLPPIPVGNHYVCYPVKALTQFKPHTAVFHDQFGTWNVYVLSITRLCTPALKRADGRVYEMVNPRLHMTCYQIRYQTGPLPPVITNDQFGPLRLTLSPATEVCLPAGKTPLK